jgi:hypothetical protein
MTAHAQIVLSRRVAPVRSFTYPVQRFGVVAGNAQPTCIH